MIDLNRKLREICEVYSWEPNGFEFLDTTIYDTENYIPGITKRLAFFQNLEGKTPSRTNMYMPGMLPNPQAFLIRSIRINGISSNLMLGSGRLIVGNKIWGVNPAWTYGMKEKGLKLEVFINPLQVFRFDLEWDTSNAIGPGFQGKMVLVRGIQVVFYGTMIRAVC